MPAPRRKPTSFDIDNASRGFVCGTSSSVDWSYVMAWVVWVLFGTFAGVLARFPIKRSVTAVLLDIGLGVLGACLGGWLFNAYIECAPVALTLNSALLAMLGAVVVLALYHSIVRRSGRTQR